MSQHDLSTNAIVERYRNVLPQARGAHLSSNELDGIISQTIAQCPLLIVGDKTWLEDLGIKKALKLNALIYGDEKRLYGGIYALTHPVRTAHRAFNFGPKNGYPCHSIEAAFIGLNHDAIEDAFRRRTQKTDDICIDLVMSCFVQPQGNGLNDSDRLGIVRDVRQDILTLTDGIGLDREEKFKQQILRAQSQDMFGMNYSSRSTGIRYLEKLDTLEGDLAHRRAAIDATPESIMHFVDLARGNLELIKVMLGPIGVEEVNVFHGVIAKLGQLVHDKRRGRAVLRRSRSPARGPSS